MIFNKKLYETDGAEKWMIYWEHNSDDDTWIRCAVDMKTKYAEKTQKKGEIDQNEKDWSTPCEWNRRNEGGFVAGSIKWDEMRRDE